MSIIEERLPWLETLELASGAHSPDGVACVMEAASYIAGEPWSDRPECVSRVIGAFLRSWNDSLSDADRQMLKPYVTRVIGTSGPQAQEEKRAWLALDWLVHECAPALLRLAGLTKHAEALETLAAVTTGKRAEKAQGTLAAARAAAEDAAGAAARDAAWAAARDAAGDALQPTVKQLQASALLLLDRMIAVK